MKTSDSTPQPPSWASWLLEKFCAPHLMEEMRGDLEELYRERVATLGTQQANWRYVRDVLSLVRPFILKRKPSLYPPPNFFDMLTNYFKIAFRQLIRKKGYSFINIGGLTAGMAVAMLIGLWVYDELSYNKYFQQYNRIAQVMQKTTYQGEIRVTEYMPIPLGNQLSTSFSNDFQYVVLSSWTDEYLLSYGEKKLTWTGSFLSPQGPHMLTLTMLKGTRSGLQDPSSIMLSESLALALFGNTEPIGKVVKIDNSLQVKVTGVYEDLPHNTAFRDMHFISPWALYISSVDWAKQAQTDWSNHSWQILVQLAPNTSFEAVSARIRDVKRKYAPESAVYKPQIFLHPMSRWHLYSQWDKTGNVGGRIEYVWLFGIIGFFVLLLACINFMNLSTARSAARAREVGIRKTVGSGRSQLIGQFLGESLLITLFAFLLSVAVVLLVLPYFNALADKKLSLLWKDPLFWLCGLVYSLITGLIAGSYPALYLSSFNPVKVLKGTFQAGQTAALTRKVLVVVQFTVSLTLVSGTLVVFRQIEHAKSRPIGYNRNGLITISTKTMNLNGHYNTLRNELLATGAVAEMATSSSPATELGVRLNGFEWEGKDPGFKDQMGVVAVTHDFGKTMGWQFAEGRDFSRAFATDSGGIVLNETAVKYMGLKDPVGKIIKWQKRNYQVLGVIKDMVMDSPFEPVYPTVFLLNYDWVSVINIKLTPGWGTSESLAKIEAEFEQFYPESLFDFKFADEQYANKFAAEERISKLAAGFTILAILISCLGLFGLASFIAEQRTKEIGVRKVLGASVMHVWLLLSKDFVGLVMLAVLIATPMAYYFMDNWLQKYEYRTSISPWMFALVSLAALFITLITVSFQAIKAAVANPVNALRNK